MQLGSKDNPHIVAPDDFSENGIIYGAFCKCHRCGLIARSIVSFDYYPLNGDGSKFQCETCQFGTPYEKVKPLLAQLEASGAFDEQNDC